jgi:hypothetical protein
MVPSRLPLLAVAAGALVACGRSPPAARFVGESAHFRLYIDRDLTVAPALDGENGLAALETAWSDTHTMLKMPDGKITYYWLTYDHIPAACGTPDEGACFWDENLEIDSATLPNPHELNHAFMHLRQQRKPIPFLAEGIADAIGCEFQSPMNVGDMPWQPLVASPRSLDLYIQGAAFVRHLIRRFGIDELLRYYEQSPERRDPALFAANFASFWGLTVDEIWSEIHDHPVTQPFIGDTKICPCSLPPVPTDGPVVTDRARAPYWTLPPLAGQTLALTAGTGGDQVSVQDCAGVQTPIRSKGVLARFDETTAPRYVLPPIATATVGPYVSEDCAVTAPYTIGPVFKGGGHYLHVAVSPPASEKVTVYLQFTTAVPWPVMGGLDAICDSCGFDPDACPPFSAQSPQTAEGTFYARKTLYRPVADPRTDDAFISIPIRP